MTAARYSTPEQPGTYWAKWKIAEDGTREGNELMPSSQWEAVQVLENGGDDPSDFLRVLVPGVQKSQSLENFMWGPGPLEEPR